MNGIIGDNNNRMKNLIRCIQISLLIKFNRHQFDTII